MGVWLRGQSTHLPTNPGIFGADKQAQIFPQSLRARGLNFAASGGAIGSIVVTLVWPVGIANVGPKIYFFFMAINLACVPVRRPPSAKDRPPLLTSRTR